MTATLHPALRELLRKPVLTFLNGEHQPLVIGIPAFGKALLSRRAISASSADRRFVQNILHCAEKVDSFFFVGSRLAFATLPRIAQAVQLDLRPATRTHIDMNDPDAARRSLGTMVYRKECAVFVEIGADVSVYLLPELEAALSTKKTA